ncbi:FkbM family methyltransferase [Flexibacterium corallicola]|uniref:FkbM family methyltransferase n=1 Tax=Flexibacterium corallicola TaxID=3037259 RepID=UPI00286EB9FB|nr:FkbM family methyltransferase [Pseudovibrio sp. M1P-2-3]
MNSEVKHVASKYGNLRIPNWPDDLIVRAISEQGEWGAVESALFSRLVTKSDTLFDLGAFLGTFSLGLLNHAKVSKVLAVEANIHIQDYLEWNLNQNMDTPWALEKCAVGQYHGWMCPQPLNQENNNGAQSFITCDENSVGAICSQPLWHLREEHGDYSLLKLDIEGSEVEALASDADYIRSKKPVIWAECNEDTRSLELFSMFIALGYRPLYVAFPAFRRDNFNGSENLIYPGVYEAALVGATDDRIKKFMSSIDADELIIRHPQTKHELRQALFETPRWCREAWFDFSKAELIALLSRMALGERFEEYLICRSSN